ncbi:hypothetical protein OF001_U250010 [Pseudomonas sp. OF001]|nr:hypothetical protein OF001_U250010 [Pseudomonas sp. OF001]
MALRSVIAGHELLATRGLRVVEYLLRGALLLDAALVEEHHLAGNLAGEVHLVGDQQHGAAFLGQRTDHVEHFLDHLRIERRGRLVEQDHLGLHAQGAGDGRALLLAAGQLGRVAVALGGDADLGQQRLGALGGLGPGQAEHAARRLDHVVEDGHVRPQVEVLEHETQLAAQAVDLPGVGGDQVAFAGGLQPQLLAGDVDLALAGVFQQVDAAQEGRLAGAGGAEDGDHVAVAGGQRDALEHLQLAVALVQVADFQGGGGCLHGYTFVVLVSRPVRGGRRDGLGHTPMKATPRALLKRKERRFPFQKLLFAALLTGPENKKSPAHTATGDRVRTAMGRTARDRASPVPGRGA